MFRQHKEAPHRASSRAPGTARFSVIDHLRTRLNIAQNRIIYVGDGSSDIHVMLHVNRLEGLTIAVSENPFIKEVAKRIVVSDDGLAVAVPILEEVLKLDSVEIRSVFEREGFLLQEWNKSHTDVLRIEPELAVDAPPDAKSRNGQAGTISSSTEPGA